jgi:hypothetical protein
MQGARVVSVCVWWDTRQAERELRSRELEEALRKRTEEVSILTKQVEAERRLADINAAQQTAAEETAKVRTLSPNLAFVLPAQASYMSPSSY